MPPKTSLAERRAQPDKTTNRHPNGSLKAEYFSYSDDAGKQVKHGKEAEWHEDGKEKLQGQWIDGQRDGLWIAWHENGQKWVEGTYQRGQPVAQWAYRDKEGKSSGARQDGMKAGTWREWNREGKTFGVGEYLDGLKNGKWTFYGALLKHDTPSIFPSIDLEYQNDVWHGQMTVYNKVGEPEIHFLFDQGREVPDKRAMYVPAKDEFGFPTRRRVEGSDRLYGILLNSKTGPTPSDFAFTPADAGPFEPANSVYQPYTEYWSGGQLRAQGRFKLGLEGKKLFHGEVKKWFSNGKKEAVFTYLNGVKHGPYVEWYENAQKKREGAYQDDKAVGIWTFWYASGRKKAELDITKQTGRLWEANGQEASVADYERLARSLLD